MASSDYVPEDLFTYAELLKMNGNHEEGEEWMEKFHELNKRMEEEFAITTMRGI